RFLITTWASPAAYLLYGAGDFRAISRNLNRELVAGVALAFGLGAWFGLPGIATAFLLSTAFGTLYPIFRAYSAQTGYSVAATVTEIWSRGAAGLTISLLCTNLALGYLANGSQLVVAAAAGCLGGLAACLVWSAIRMRREDTTLPPGTVLRLMNSL